MKFCIKCNKEKLISEFGIRKKSIDGLNPYCKTCLKELDKKYYISSRKNYMNYYNKEEKVKEYNSEWIKNNINQFKQNRQNWEDNNKEKIKEYSKKYQKLKYKNDINFKLSLLLRTNLNRYVKKGKNKYFSSLTLLNCTLEEFKIHLEKQFKPEMSWENHGKIWEIDHIVPCSKFDLSKEEEQRKCFNFKNLQPLYKKENRVKSNKIL